MTGNERIQSLAARLSEVERTRVSTAPLTSDVPDLTVEEAYQIQLVNIDRKVNAGDTIVGKKIGLTSLAMQNLLGVDQPDYGHLLHSMVVENRGNISSDKVLQPRVEGEIAFVLKQDLAGPHVTTIDVLRATDYVLPALEIVDSRIADWKIKLPDTIADNASSGLYVLGGRPMKVDQVDLTQVGMVLYKNGQMMNTGVGAACLGNPAYCVAWLANALSRFGIVLKAGEVILSGAFSAMVLAEPGDHFTARFAHLGEASVSFTA